jgi:hypothetical protein
MAGLGPRPNPTDRYPSLRAVRMIRGWLKPPRLMHPQADLPLSRRLLPDTHNNRRLQPQRQMDRSHI